MKSNRNIDIIASKVNDLGGTRNANAMVGKWDDNNGRNKTSGKNITIE